jgi:hydrogenase expression/formation protein HypE
MTPFTCPVPMAAADRVLLGHGSGGRLSAELLRGVFLPALDNPVLRRLDDQAIVDIAGARLAVTTDSFVVKPLFFPGGDIGSLAIHGTINDLAVGGADPLYIAVAFILEEGLPLDVLQRVVGSLSAAAARAGVAVITGDTKVVEHGACDGLFITTTGIGVVRGGVELSASNAAPGDIVIVSGALGDHGMAILACREGLEFETTIASDSAALHGLTRAMLDAAPHAIHAMRDLTRGGLASALNEIAAASRTGIELDESTLPVRDEVRGACELLGLDPLYVANEGKLVAFVEPQHASAVLDAMRHHPLGGEARIIGAVVDRDPGLVTMRTVYGPSRVVDLLPGDQLPRIC